MKGDDKQEKKKKNKEKMVFKQVNLHSIASINTPYNDIKNRTSIWIIIIF